LGSKLPGQDHENNMHETEGLLKEISQIYENLKAFLDEIIVTARKESNFNPIVYEDNDDPSFFSEQLEQLEVSFNDKPFNLFIDELNKILSTTAKNLKETVEIEGHENKSEVDKIINNIIENIKSKKAFIIKSKDDKFSVNEWVVSDHFIHIIIKSLKDHKRGLWEDESKVTLKMKKTKHPLVHNNAPLRWNENINKLVDLFYQLAFEISTRDKEPLLEVSSANLANFIVNNFIDQDGLPLSLDTVQTCLKPGREDKRPQPHSRIQLKYIP
jgi:hypothetical protein